MYKRAQYQIITERLKESRHFLQVVLGPRQVGKTTVIKQVVNDLKIPYQIYSADSIPATQTSWISDCWNTARVQMRVEKLSEFIIENLHKPIDVNAARVIQATTHTEMEIPEKAEVVNVCEAIDKRMGCRYIQ